MARDARRRRATALGLVSVLLWSTTVAASRLVMERLGVFPGAAVVLLSSGGVLFLATCLRHRGVRWLASVSVPHLVRAGPVFLLYMLAMYGAVGLAATRAEAIVGGLANYIWPTLILVFSILILREKARPLFVMAGSLLALAGIGVGASVSAGGIRGLARALSSPSVSLALGLAAGVLWALYSVLGRRHRQAVPSGALSLSFLASGVAMAALAGVEWRGIDFDLPTALTVLYMVFLPTSLAYGLWELAVKDGDVATLGTASNLIPILSAAIAILFLGVAWRWELVLGAALVSVGAGVARAAFGEGRRGTPEGTPSQDRAIR